MKLSSLGPIRLLAIAGLLATGVTGNIHAQIIAYKFVGGNPGSTLDTTNDSTGVVATTGWQGVSGTNPAVNSLIDTSGNTTTANFTLTSAGNEATWGAGADPSGLIASQKLLGSWVEADSGGLTLNLTNIPYATYDIYVYGGRQAGDRTNAAFSVSDGTLIYSGIAQTGGTIPSTFTLLDSGTGGADFGDYAVFSSETSSTLTLTLGGALPSISGFEIVNTSSVPEPSTWLLLGLSFLGLFLSKRRRLISSDL